MRKLHLTPGSPPRRGRPKPRLVSLLPAPSDSAARDPGSVAGRPEGAEGASEEPIIRPRHPIGMAADEAAAAFVAWMRGMGFAGRTWTSEQLVAFLDWWHHDANVRALPHQLVLSYVKRAPGVTVQRARMVARGGAEAFGRRPVLYTIDDDLAAEMPITGARRLPCGEPAAGRGRRAFRPAPRSGVGRRQ